MRTLNCGRRAARKTVDLRCSLRPRGGPEQRHRIVELSALGAWLPTAHPLPMGQLVEVSLTLTGAPPLSLRAEVMWTRPGVDGGMGIEFVNLDAGARERLDAALASAPMAPGRGAPMAPGRGAPMAPGRGAPMAPGRGAPMAYTDVYH